MTKYRHYKGGIYELVCVARLESDPDVQMIVYRSENGTIWTRPESVFFELVDFNQKQVQRFTAID